MAEIYGTNKADSISGTFLVDEIYGGNGNDTIGGEFVDITIVIDFPNENFLFGTSGDIIDGGNGNDILAGDFVRDSAYWLAETVNQFVFFGDDTIYGGNGNDIISGDIIDEYGYQIGAPGEPAPFVQFTVLLGNDTLHGGNGNDVITGDQAYAQIYASNVEIHGTVILGNDTIYGDNGNDTILGDSNARIIYENGTTGDFTRIFGADYLNGGDGNDVIVGDAFLDSWEQDATSHVNVFEVYGNDTIIGGKGDDILYGDFVTAVQVDGQVNLRGFNTFVYNLADHEGHDLIMDFLGTNDSLQFTHVIDTNNNGLDFHDVDTAITSFHDNGNGFLQVDFKTGTSITFATIAFDHQDSIADIVQNASQIIVTA